MMRAVGPTCVSRRALLTGVVAVFPVVAYAQIASDRVFTPEMFGAKGDGVTNDSAALAMLAAAVNANGGGTVRFRRTTYIVGRQIPSPAGARSPWTPAPLLAFARCRRALRVMGNGARLKCANGLRYGTFNRDGSVLKHAMPYAGPGACTPYDSMIAAVECTGPIEVSDLELDGNLPGLAIGGAYGDTGWQIHALGLALFNNSGPELVRNVHIHHHAQDGLYIDGLDAVPPSPVSRVISNVVSEYNGRQGCSIVGGRGYAFDHCRFSHTGRGGLGSAPGAGVDIEAEGKKNRGFTFTNCLFADNVGCGMVADSGDTEDVSFVGCRFTGTTSWSAWPSKPRMRFRSCDFVGAVVAAHGDDDPARAAQFFDCVFHDDARLAPEGRIYGGTNPSHPLLDLSDAQNVRFSRCRFLAARGVVPWSTRAIYDNCVMRQQSKQQGYPRGTFLGRNFITANVDLYGSKVLGEVTLNGRLFARMHF